MTLTPLPAGTTSVGTRIDKRDFFTGDVYSARFTPSVSVAWRVSQGQVSLIGAKGRGDRYRSKVPVYEGHRDANEEDQRSDGMDKVEAGGRGPWSDAAEWQREVSHDGIDDDGRRLLLQ